MGFFDGGAKTLGFGEVNSPEAAAVFGKWRGGRIVNIGDAKQATNIDTGELQFWPKSQDPVMQLPITLDTAAGKCPEPPTDDEDDGVRDFYITKGKQNYQAARNAMKKAGAKDFEVGGFLYVRWVSGVGQRGDARQFEMFYEPPTQTSAGFMNDAPGEQPAPRPSMPPQVTAAGGTPGQPYPDVSPRFDPATGQPLAPPPAASTPAPRFDPNTGQPLAPAPVAAPPEQPRFDPATGAPMNAAAQAVLAGPPAANTPVPSGPGPQGSQPVNPYAR